MNYIKYILFKYGSLIKLDKLWHLVLRLLNIQKGYMIHGNILLEDYKSIYFFIPKVASSSIKKAINIKIKAQDKSLVNLNNGKAHGKSASIHVRDFPYVDKKELHGKYSSYFKFLFVRNPYDRIVSYYKNRIKENNKYNISPFIKGVSSELLKYGNFQAGMGFEEFVRELVKIPDKDADNHFKSYFYWLKKYNIIEKGAKLKNDKIINNEGEILVDYVGRLKTLSEDFSYIKDKIGLSDVSLPHMMKSKRKANYRSYYNDKSKELIKERYKNDLELFNYSF